MVMTAFVGWPSDGHPFSADEVGRAMSGFVVRDASGVPRTGMLGVGPAVSAVPASWKVEVPAFVYVHQVAGAIQLSGLSSAEQVDIAPSTGIPAGQSRIDAVCWDPLAAALAVVKGTPAVTPLVPSIGSRGRVGEVRVTAGDGMVIGEQVEPVFQFADRLPGSVSKAPGYSVGSGTSVEKDASGMVDATIELQRATGELATDVWMGTLEDGFRPSMTIETSGAISVGGSAGPVFVQIRPNGGVYVFNPSPGNRRLVVSARYRAG